MKKHFWGLCMGLLLGQAVWSQSITTPRILVLAPLYLDSAFAGEQYRWGNAAIPRNALNGLDFYHGIRLAADSLQQKKLSLSITVWDSKMSEEKLLLKLDSLSAAPPQLILAAFGNRSEIGSVAAFAKENKVPLLSMTLPNDGGVLDNPYFYMANPGLRTQVEHLCHYLQKNHPLETIQLLTRKGAMEEQVLSHFYQFNRQTKGSPLKFNTTQLPDSLSAADLWRNLDSTQAQVWVGASLQDAFASQLVRLTAQSRNKRIKLLGMPTWENLRDLPKEADYIYATAFVYNRNDAWINQLTQKYREQIFGRPSDMVFKGFEALFHFGQLLALFPNDLPAHLNNSQFSLSNPFQFLPVRNKTNLSQTEYWENKQVYFVRKAKGETRTIE